LIQVRLIEDVFTPQRNRQMVEKLTDAMISIEGENMRGVTWVTIEEVKSADLGSDGTTGVTPLPMCMVLTPGYIPLVSTATEPTP
jgi:4-oxalocrotonate tautomerase